MKKSLPTVCRVLIYITLVLSLASPALGQETLKISAPASLWAQEDGERLSGPVIDLVTEIFAEFDIKVVSEKLPWARAIANMESGKLDLMPVIFYSEDRAKFMSFSDPYVAVPTVVFVPQGKAFSFLDCRDLIGRRGLVIRRANVFSECDSFRPQLEISEVVNEEALLKMLDSNRADYAVAAKYATLVEAQRLGYQQKIETLPVPVASRSLHMAISNKSAFLPLLPRINAKLEEMRSNGRIEKMIQQALANAAELKQGE